VHFIAAGKEIYNGDLIEEAELKKRRELYQGSSWQENIRGESLRDIVAKCIHLVESSSRNRK